MKAKQKKKGVARAMGKAGAHTIMGEKIFKQDGKLDSRQTCSERR